MSDVKVSVKYYIDPDGQVVTSTDLVVLLNTTPAVKSAYESLDELLSDCECIGEFDCRQDACDVATEILAI